MPARFPDPMWGQLKKHVDGFTDAEYVAYWRGMMHARAAAVFAEEATSSSQLDNITALIQDTQEYRKLDQESLFGGEIASRALYGDGMGDNGQASKESPDVPIQTETQPD